MQGKRIIKFQNVIKKIDSLIRSAPILDDVSFEVYEGEFVVIHTENDEQNSVVFKILGGMDSATYGNVWICDEIISKNNKRELSNYRQNVVGIIFSDFNLVPNLNLRENLQLVASISNKPFDVEKILESIGLADKAGNYESSLSFDEQIKGAFARALIKNPLILLCDVDLTKMDAASRKHFLKMLKNINFELKKTVVIVTMNKSIVEIADKVVRIKAGKVECVIENLEPEDIERIEL